MSEEMLTILQKRAREEDVEIVIRMPTSKRRWVLHHRRCGNDQPNQKELRDELVKARNDLNVANDRLHEMTLQCMDNKTQLKRERLIKDIAVSCIPDDKLDEFELRCPIEQPQWSRSSSPVMDSADLR